MPQQNEGGGITGASGGIGRAAAREFAAGGARLALIARGRRGLEGAAPGVEQARGEAMQLPVAVPDPAQVTWGRTKLPKQTMPVPPMYQPEVAADAIHYAAQHKRRQIYVGIPTVMNILGERVAPWLLDRYLAKTGYNSQMTGQDLDPL